MRVVQEYSRDAWVADLKREFKRLLVVIRDLKVKRDPWTELELKTDIRDLTINFVLREFWDTVRAVY